MSTMMDENVVEIYKTEKKLFLFSYSKVISHVKFQKQNDKKGFIIKLNLNIKIINFKVGEWYNDDIYQNVVTFENEI